VTRRRAERGFALLIVLWTLVLLTLITSGLTASGRGEVKLAGNLRDAAVAEAAADGAVQETIFHLVAGQWAPGPGLHEVRVGNAVVIVRVEDELGLINPNSAPLPLLAALLRDVGADARTARILADAIVQFHDAGGADPSAYIAAGLPYGPAMRNFRTVSELRLVAGMTPALYARLAPHLSVVKLATTIPDGADPVVATAFSDAGPNGGFEPNDNTRDASQSQSGLLVVRITAMASFGTAQYSRLAEVRVLGQTRRPPRPAPYRIMSWSTPED
jgi:general secretion pathway protein K